MVPRARKHCVFKDEVTGERFQWLMEQPDPTKPWGLGCIVCRAAGSYTKMGRCAFGRTLGSMTLQNLCRHGNNNQRKKTAASVVFEHSEVWQANSLNKFLSSTHLSFVVFVCGYVCPRRCEHIWTRKRVCVCSRACSCLSVFVRACVCSCVCVCVCVSVFMRL